MNEYIKLAAEILLAIIGAGIAFKLLKVVFRFLKNHIAIGKNVDNSHVESGATVNKIIGDNATMNVGVQIYDQDEEPEEMNVGDIWIGR